MQTNEQTSQLPVSKPLIVVVEDKPIDLSQRVEALQDFGCRAVGFLHSDEAIKEIIASPGIDLIFTDIDLDGSGTDKSGIALAEFVKDMRLDIPVYAISAYFSDEGLTEDERSYFGERWFYKGSMRGEEINKMYETLAETAKAHRSERASRVDGVLQALRAKYDIEKKEFEQVRQFILKSENSSELERILSEQQYTLRILQPKNNSGLKMPVPIWMREADEGIEVEVYSFPELYAFGDTEEEAIEKTIELILLLAEDAKQEEDEMFSECALPLKEFLEYVA